MRRRQLYVTAALLIWALLATGSLHAADLSAALATLQSVDRGGKASGDAAAAWRQASQASADQIPLLLAALDEAKPLGANYIRTAIETVCARATQAGEKLPYEELEKFLLDREHTPRARRLSYELLVASDAGAADRLLPKMLDDPSLELRRDAVARKIDEAKSALEAENKDAAMEAYQLALTNARDLDQVQAIAGELRKLERTVDLAKHFGFVTSWQLIGPFDNSGRKGHSAVYPPEQEFNPESTYAGKHGEVGWKDYVTKDEFGQVDLNDALAKEKSVAGYARAEFFSEREQPVEIRLGSLNATKVWVNGKLVADNEVYHALTKMDQYVGRTTLTPGKNVILVKVCQNEQTEDWAVDWKFQLRVCDETGTAIHSSADSLRAKQAFRKIGTTR